MRGRVRRNFAEFKKHFWGRVQKRGPRDCWLWRGGKTTDGYGETFFQGRVEYVHRIVWRLAGNTVPAGYRLYRRCKNGFCCNPAHMYIDRPKNHWLLNQEQLVKGFWRRVQKSRAGGCWLWMGSQDRSGYGRLWFSKRGRRCNRSAHRLAWELLNGPVSRGKHVLHHCDVPACVNPAHLFLGTQKDNMVDAQCKSRLQKKLTKGAVRDIRQRYQTGKTTLEALARKYHVSSQSVHRVVTGKSWRHVR